MISYRSHEGYGEILLNHPEKHHAITFNMAQQLNNLINDICIDEIKFLVISSTGNQSFCSGGDLTEFHSQLDKQEAFEKLKIMNQALQSIAYFKLPTIAILNGHAFGGGCELATACDFRFAFPDKKFGFIQSNLGILPGWGGDALLYERLPRNKAFKWMITGEVYTSEALVSLGWIEKIIEPYFQPEKLFKTYLNKTSEQMQILKQHYLNNLSSDLIFQMEKGSKKCAQLWGSKQHRNAVDRFLNK